MLRPSWSENGADVSERLGPEFPPLSRCPLLALRCEFGVASSKRETTKKKKHSVSPGHKQGGLSKVLLRQNAFFFCQVMKKQKVAVFPLPLELAET